MSSLNLLIPTKYSSHFSSSVHSQFGKFSESQLEVSLYLFMLNYMSNAYKLCKGPLSIEAFVSMCLSHNSYLSSIFQFSLFICSVIKQYNIVQ